MSVDVAVAVTRDAATLALRSWRVEQTVARELLAAIDETLREAGVDRAGIGAIAVDVGPGQYGAVRTGVATAQGLALALGVPLAGVGRLEADAYGHQDAGGAVVAVHDAGRSGLAWAAFSGGRVLIAPRLGAAAELVRAAPRGAVWCGESNPALAAARDAEGESGDTIPPDTAERALALVAIATRDEAFGDPAAVDATYLRPPSITRPGRQS